MARYIVKDHSGLYLQSFLGRSSAWCHTQRYALRMTREQAREVVRGDVFARWKKGRIVRLVPKKGGGK